MSRPWYEVWVDEGLSPPYILLVLPEGDRVDVFDPKKDKVVHVAAAYEDAKLWLLEDEYTRVEGRMLPEE